MNLRRWQWAGWVLFSVSALAFIVSAWRAGDMIALFGAVAFMVANVAFMVAHFEAKNTPIKGERP